MTMETLQENVFLSESGMNFIQWRRSVWMFFLQSLPEKNVKCSYSFPHILHCITKKNTFIFSELVFLVRLATDGKILFKHIRLG